MANINDRIRNLHNKSAAIRSDIEKMTSEYDSICVDLDKRYREELSYGVSIESLSVFNSLKNNAKRNTNSLKNVLILLKNLRNLTIFDISEIEEELLNEDIHKLLKK